jgi:hypothetical protein
MTHQRHLLLQYGSPGRTLRSLCVVISHPAHNEEGPGILVRALVTLLSAPGYVADVYTFESADSSFRELSARSVYPEFQLDRGRGTHRTFCWATYTSACHFDRQHRGVLFD